MDDRPRPFLARKLGAGTKVPDQISSMADFWSGLAGALGATIEAVLDRPCEISLRQQEAVTGLEHWARDKADRNRADQAPQKEAPQKEGPQGEENPKAEAPKAGAKDDPNADDGAMADDRGAACYIYDLGTSVSDIQLAIAHPDRWARYLGGQMLGDAEAAEAMPKPLALMLGEAFVLALGARLTPLLKQSPEDPMAEGEPPAPAISLHKSSYQPEQLGYLKKIKMLGSTFDIELGDETYSMVIFIDYEALLQLSHTMAQSEAQDSAQEDPDTRRRLQTIVQATPVPLNVILEQLPMTIGECSRITIGSEFVLPGVSLSSLKLFAQTSEGDVEIAAGALGVWKQFRALKLNRPVNKDFVMTIGDAQ